MTVTIRPRREGDLSDLAAVLVRVHALDGYPVEGVADPEGWLRHPNELQSWTAVRDDTPIGQVTLARGEPNDDAASAWHEHTGGDVDRLAIPARLFVDPDHRGSGAGRLLMEAALDFARALGFAVALDVMLKDRAAIKLYERLGAKRISDVTHQYGDGLTEVGAVYVVPTSSRSQDSTA
jgi:GNAT superfamily N-acetyltransferase